MVTAMVAWMAVGVSAVVAIGAVFVGATILASGETRPLTTVEIMSVVA